MPGMSPKNSAPTKSAPVAFSVGDDEQFRSPDFQARLVGVVYDIYVPKSSASIALARTVQKRESASKKAKGKNPGKVDIAAEAEAIEDILEWADKVLGDSAGEVRARMQDPKDKLDIEHISELMEKVIEWAREDSEDPTS